MFVVVSRVSSSIIVVGLKLVMCRVSVVVVMVSGRLISVLFYYWCWCVCC